MVDAGVGQLCANMDCLPISCWSSGTAPTMPRSSLMIAHVLWGILRLCSWSRMASIVTVTAFMACCCARSTWAGDGLINFRDLRGVEADKRAAIPAFVFLAATPQGTDSAAPPAKPTQPAVPQSHVSSPPVARALEQLKGNTNNVPLRGPLPPWRLNAPTNLTYSPDVKLCEAHGGTLACGFFPNSQSIPLLWDWRPCAAADCIQRPDGYRLYRVGVPPVVTPRARAENLDHGIVRPRWWTKVADVNASMTVQGVVWAHKGDCFVVTAYQGQTESGPSGEYCISYVMKTAVLKPSSARWAYDLFHDEFQENENWCATGSWRFNQVPEGLDGWQMYFPSDSLATSPDSGSVASYSYFYPGKNPFPCSEQLELTMRHDKNRCANASHIELAGRLAAVEVEHCANPREREVGVAGDFGLFQNERSADTRCSEVHTSDFGLCQIRCFADTSLRKIHLCKLRSAHGQISVHPQFGHLE